MNTSTIKRFLFVVFTAISVSLMVSESAEGGRLSPGLQRSAIDNPDECVTALVFFTPDIEEKVSLSASLKFISTFSDRYKKAHSKLMSASRKSFNAFFSELGEDGVGLQIKKKFWIANAVEITAKRADLARLAEFESVDLIVEDTVLELVEPVEVSDPSISLGSSGAEQNLVAINADKLWKQGLTGAGRLVMSFDTGVDGDHPGLADRWRGATSGNPSAAWFDVLGTDFPDDNVGHGTHVMGLMAGVFNGDTVGVAPDVEWGCAAVVDRGSGFSQTISDILSAFEWAADPDGNPETTDDLPDVICHSWGIPKGIFDPCDNTFWQAIDNLEQLGIVNIFACGNEGPDGGTIRNPADRASSPLNSFSVGAVNQNVLGYPVANFSSRGPANCDSTIIKPEIVAPGVLIKSLYPNASTKLMSGTSMAAPQVAGAVALLRQYNPNATVEQIKQALLLSATDIGEQGEDNASGFGLIDLEKALDYMPAPNRAVMEFSTFEITDDGNGVIEPDETARLITEIRIRNHDVVGLWGVLRSEDSSVTVLTDSVYFGNLSAGVLVTNHSEPFIVHADQNITPGSVVTFRLDFSDESGAPLNYVYFGIVMAQGQNAASASMDNGQIAIGDCNYGMVGLGPRSIVDMGEAGFSIDSTNYLAEFALIVSDSEGRVSDAGRNITGLSSDNDFLAGEGAILMTFPEQSWGDLEMTGRFTDGLAEDAIGVDVKQTVSLFYEGDLSSAAFVSYSIGNIDPFAVHELSVGLVVDIDFYGDEQGLEMIDIDPNRNLVFYFDNEVSKYVGVGFVSGAVNSFSYFPNSFDSKVGLSDTLKANVLWSGNISDLPSKRADYAHVMSMAPTTISGDETVELTAVIIWAESESELMQRYDDAYDKFNSPTAADEDSDPVLPEDFSLSQNYPNPFNPQTTIEFSLSRAQRVSLTVYNVLGQEVMTLLDRDMDEGIHDVSWSGTNESGNAVASGVYFYRLKTSTGELTRKMLFLR